MHPSEAATSPTDPSPPGLARARRFLAGAIGLTALGYAGWALWSGFAETASELASFRWSFYLPVLGLTLVNYGLRFAKWAYLLERVGVRVPLMQNARIFTAGLAMVVSPAKAGEVLKPWLVREATGAPLARTLPVLVAERVTDGVAVVALAAIGVSTYHADGVPLIAATVAACLGGFGIIASPTLSLGLIRGVARLAPGPGRWLEESYASLRVCAAPAPLAVTMALSLAAWWAECIGCWLVFRGMGVEAGLDVSTFLYAFATVFGAPSPGGVGMADAALGEGAVALLPAITHAQAIAAALLVRAATLWFGVLLGAVALIGLDPKAQPA